MKSFFKNIYYSFPVQLLILHFRKYQVLLFFWIILASTIDSGFMKSYGADALFFVPEYLGQVNALSAGLVGIAMAVFFMSWNITTFILHTHRFKFLAASRDPFLNYCINNSILPVAFLVFYLIRSVQFNVQKELLDLHDELWLITGFLLGFILLLSVSFGYFFGAEKGIVRILQPPIDLDDDSTHHEHSYDEHFVDALTLKTSYYFNTRFALRKVRNIAHYDHALLEKIFKHHHFAAIVCMLLAFIFLITGGFFLDVHFFEAPAAVSIIIFFALLTAFIGSLTYFLKSWTLITVLLALFGLNYLYQKDIIDPRNKAYGLNYTNIDERPKYSKQELQQICTPSNIESDRSNMIAVLNNWKQHQQGPKPKIYFINVSGGGLRSATFVMNTFQKLDSIFKGGLMNNTFMISGASGGMLSATFYRELYLQQKSGAAINPDSTYYNTNITQDLLNPVFSSLVSRDLFSPAQKFSVSNHLYVKDRGYAFEEKLNENAGGLLNKQLKDYVRDEQQAKIPLMVYNSTITRDGRKMMICSQPLSFLMKPVAMDTDSTYNIDFIDFTRLFKKQDPYDIRLLTALRMNATFPYVLPNVWLPTDPVIDVMDAGLRDNYGQEITLRFIQNFKDWIRENTSGVVIIQLRDRLKDNWQQKVTHPSLFDNFLNPGTMLQHSWYKFQDNFQNNELSYISDSSLNIHRFTFMYVPEKEDQTAALNFHLTAIEKKDVIASFHSLYNQQVLKELMSYIR